MPSEAPRRIPRVPRLGRAKPYTNRQIRRVPCARCGQPSTQQWSICALDNRYLGVCDACDMLINEVVMRVMRIPNRVARLPRYRARVARR